MRIFYLVTFVGSQSLDFLGSSDESTGNFLKLKECVAKIDSSLANHLQKIKDKDTKNQ